MHNKKKLLTHYTYIKQIAITRIKDLHWPIKKQRAKKRKNGKETASTQTRARNQLHFESNSTSSSKCTIIDNNALDQVKDKLNCRPYDVFSISLKYESQREHNVNFTDGREVVMQMR